MRTQLKRKHLRLLIILIWVSAVTLIPANKLNIYSTIPNLLTTPTPLTTNQTLRINLNNPIKIFPFNYNISYPIIFNSCYKECLMD